MPFVVGEVLTCEPVAGKSKLKQLTVNIGSSESITVITNAPNIRVGTRTVVAEVGTEFDDKETGEMAIVRKELIGGVYSEGMICDSVILGWAGGAAGVAVQVPPSCALGSPAPTSKPRMDGISAEPEQELSAKELKLKEKAARKLQLEEKKAARKAAKDGKTAADESEEVGEEDGKAES